MSQLDIWTDEYKTHKNLPSSRVMEPSKVLVSFFQSPYINNVHTALDAGCGMGRNSIYLAEHDIFTTGIDFVPKAIEEAKKNASEKGLENMTEFFCHKMSDPFPIQEKSVDLVIDMMSIHTLHEDERIAYSKEVTKALKKHGFFLFFSIAASSPAAQALCKDYPADEPSSYYIPQTGAFEKAFTKDDFQKLFPNFTFQDYQEYDMYTPAFDDTYHRLYCSGILQME